MVIIQNSPQNTWVLLSSGSCSTNVSVPGGYCYVTRLVDTLLVFAPSRADHHLSVRCAGENEHFSGCPASCHSTPDILRVVTIPISPTKPRSDWQYKVRQLQGFSRQMAR